MTGTEVTDIKDRTIEYIPPQFRISNTLRAYTLMHFVV